MRKSPFSPQRSRTPTRSRAPAPSRTSKRQRTPKQQRTPVRQRSSVRKKEKRRKHKRSRSSCRSEPSGRAKTRSRSKSLRSRSQSILAEAVDSDQAAPSQPLVPPVPDPATPPVKEPSEEFEEVKVEPEHTDSTLRVGSGQRIFALRPGRQPLPKPKPSGKLSHPVPPGRLNQLPGASHKPKAKPTPSV